MTKRLPIPGLEGFYEVSANGEIYSVERVSGFIRYPSQKIKQAISTTGYFYFNSSCNGAKKKVKTHHAVLMAFRGPRPDGYQGAHLDGNPKNNRLENLEWVTPAENQSHRLEHGTHNRGERHGMAKLTFRQVRWMRARRGQFTYDELAEFYDVSKATISRVMNRNGWRHVE